MNVAEKKEKIKQIKKYLTYTLKKIKVYCKEKNTYIILFASDDNKYIYCNYGQIAIKNNIQELTWQINSSLEAKKQNIDFEII